MNVSLGLSFSSENSNADASFQEALTREKVEEKREERFKLTILGRRDSSEPAPHKKVMREDSGWWSITSDVTSENWTTRKDRLSNTENKMLNLSKCENKYVEC